MFKFTHEQLNKMVLGAMQEPKVSPIQKVMDTVERMKQPVSRLMGKPKR